MSPRWSLADLAAVKARLAGAPIASSTAPTGGPPPGPPINAPIEFGKAQPTPKYRNTRVCVDGWLYPSKLQARCKQALDLRKAAGEILWYIEEVPFRLPGKTIHRVDFLAVLANGGVELIEAKGRDHPGGRLKRRQVEELYGVRIHLFTR